MAYDGNTPAPGKRKWLAKPEYNRQRLQARKAENPQRVLDARALAIQIEAQEDLHFFTRYMFKMRRGIKWLDNDHHKLICDGLMRVYSGQCTRLIINVPPRYSKTEIAVINFMAWSLGKCPDAEFIHTSYSGRLAANNSWQAREMVSHDAYKTVFPDFALKTDSSAKDEWRTQAGGCVYAVGAGGTITGYGAGKEREGFGGAILIDDPHKSDEALSNVVRRGVLDWFQNTLESRKNSRQTPIILVMQRLHEEDLSGWLLKGGNGEKWDHICLPALKADGTAMWPEKHTVEELTRMQKASSYTFSGQYQQRPSPLGGSLIRTSWFVRYKQVPALRFRFITADTAQKTAERNDYSVFQHWGATMDGRAILLDVRRGKWEAPELKRTAREFWIKCAALDRTDGYGRTRNMYIEDKSSGTGLIQELARPSIEDMKAGHPRIPIKGIERTKDKLTEWMDAIPHIESGSVMIPEAAEWLSDFTAECEQLTAQMTHAHDDQIDPMCDAIDLVVANKKLLGLWANL